MIRRECISPLTKCPHTRDASLALAILSSVPVCALLFHPRLHPSVLAPRSAIRGLSNYLVHESGRCGRKLATKAMPICFCQPSFS